jgi:hypothetical protein
MLETWLVYARSPPGPVPVSPTRLIMRSRS